MKAIEQKKIAIIKSNAAPDVKLRALEKLNASDATDDNVKNNWVKQDASDFDLRRLKELNDAIINLCKGGASLESKVTGLSNLKSMISSLEYVNKEITRALGGKKMNSFDKKKLAIIKSNAAPEVKLRAIEKLNENAIKSNDAKQDVVRLAQQLVRMCDEVKQNIKSLEAEAKRTADDDFVAKDILEELKDIQVHLKQAKEYRY